MPRRGGMHLATWRGSPGYAGICVVCCKRGGIFSRQKSGSRSRLLSRKSGLVIRRNQLYRIRSDQDVSGGGSCNGGVDPRLRRVPRGTFVISAAPSSSVVSVSASGCSGGAAVAARAESRASACRSTRKKRTIQLRIPICLYPWLQNMITTSIICRRCSDGNHNFSVKLAVCRVAAGPPFCYTKRDT